MVQNFYLKIVIFGYVLKDNGQFCVFVMLSRLLSTNICILKNSSVLILRFLLQMLVRGLLHFFLCHISTWEKLIFLNLDSYISKLLSRVSDVVMILDQF